MVADRGLGEKKRRTFIVRVFGQASDNIASASCLFWWCNRFFVSFEIAEFRPSRYTPIQNQKFLLAKLRWQELTTAKFSDPKKKRFRLKFHVIAWLRSPIVTTVNNSVIEEPFTTVDNHVPSLSQRRHFSRESCNPKLYSKSVKYFPPDKLRTTSFLCFGTDHAEVFQANRHWGEKGGSHKRSPWNIFLCKKFVVPVLPIPIHPCVLFCFFSQLSKTT